MSAALTCYGLAFVMWCEEPPAPPPAIVCPTIESWSGSFQNGLANELQALPPHSRINEVVRQHIRLRDKIRKCKKK